MPSRKCRAESAEIWLPAFTSVRESEVAQMPIGDFEREAQTIQKRPLTDYVFKDLLTVSMVPFSRFKWDHADNSLQPKLGGSMILCRTFFKMMIVSFTSLLTGTFLSVVWKFRLHGNLTQHHYLQICEWPAAGSLIGGHSSRLKSAQEVVRLTPRNFEFRKLCIGPPHVKVHWASDILSSENNIAGQNVTCLMVKTT